MIGRVSHANSFRGKKFIRIVKNYTFAEYTGRTAQGPKREVGLIGSQISEYIC
jgi:hypothetical protein